MNCKFHNRILNFLKTNIKLNKIINKKTIKIKAIIILTLTKLYNLYVLKMFNQICHYLKK